MQGLGGEGGEGVIETGLLLAPLALEGVQVQEVGGGGCAEGREGLGEGEEVLGEGDVLGGEGEGEGEGWGVGGVGCTGRED